VGIGLCELSSCYVIPWQTQQDDTLSHSPIYLCIVDCNKNNLKIHGACIKIHKSVQ